MSSWCIVSSILRPPCTSRNYTPFPYATLFRSCRMVAQELEGIAPLDERQALGDQPLELDRADPGAVLLALGAALGVLVVGEAALGPVDLALEEVDQGPEQVREKIGRASRGEREGQNWESSGVSVALKKKR